MAILAGDHTQLVWPAINGIKLRQYELYEHDIVYMYNTHSFLANSRSCSLYAIARPSICIVCRL